MPWHPPALADAWVAWVDGREQRWLDTDIWAKRTDRGDPPFPLARAPGPQSHIVGDGPFLAWTTCGVTRGAATRRPRASGPASACGRVWPAGRIAAAHPSMSTARTASGSKGARTRAGPPARVPGFCTERGTCPT
jgi:hypothetical protein